ncbi:uncharacterized protein EV154DRAFT_602015 [Mucor mucedo]|uniref:uncharacterized protein n=1 Tax=Mucor mucedo TaxID=29922 RepID=UPI00221EDEB2|nr:uncharacterized protein EV154DRAFT_602015 [Mucor mucedo]KAI7892076.1 hypothetical protein EV154DRAFT_602015 [Mucor mucedo]
MMENTAHINHGVTLDNGYLKSAKDYLSSTPVGHDASLNRPRVIQWDPHMGTDQSTISVVLEQAISDPHQEIRPMKIVFGQLVVETNQQQQRAPTASPISSQNNANLIWITLVAHVPRFSDTLVENIHQQVPLSICVYENTNTDTAIDHWNFGVFTYKKGAAEVKQENNSNKRSATDALNDYPSSKRIHTSASLDDDQLFNQLLAPFDDSPGKNTNNNGVESRPQTLLAPQPSNPISILSQITSNQQPYPPTPTEGGGYYGFNDYSQPTAPPAPQQHQQQHASMLVNIQPNPSSNTHVGYANSASYNSTMPYHPGYANNGSSNYNLSGAGSMYTGYGNMQAHGNMLSSQQQVMMSHHNQSNMNGHPFAGVLSKANLNITGDLMEMTYTWTQDEWTNGRRLVEFWRRQGGDDKLSQSDDETISEVECGFKPIEQELYQQQRIRENLAAQKDSSIKKRSNPLVVSCIYWQERNDYFITSVDCIYLLEGLIGVQFTVEEKNRIRRNLEGFRPLTVSKCKPECADFFKLIMSFPHPKPRNIEKDVKVFSWKTLPNALRKIIRKYTPSYSSTAVVNLNNL